MANAQDLSAPLAVQAKRVSRPTNRVSAKIADGTDQVRALWRSLEADPAMTFHQGQAWVDAWIKGTGTELFLVTLEQDGNAFAILPLEIITAAAA